MEAVEDPILHPPPPYPQLIDAIAQIVSFWAAEFVPQRGQALDPGDAGRVGTPVATSQRAEPVESRHLAIRFLVEHASALSILKIRVPSIGPISETGKNQGGFPWKKSILFA